MLENARDANYRPRNPLENPLRIGVEMDPIPKSELLQDSSSFNAPQPPRDTVSAANASLSSDAPTASPKDAFFDAVNSGDVNKVGEMLDKDPQAVNRAYEAFRTQPIMLAAQNDDAPMIKELARRGADLNAQEYGTHFTAVHIAVEGQNYAALTELIDQKADLTKRDAANMRPLDRAVAHGDLQAVAKLGLAMDIIREKIERKGFVPGQTPLHEKAASSNQLIH